MHDYDNRVDGTPPPAELLARQTTPQALRQRAAIRMEIARQDMKAGDTAAYYRNVSVASQMLRRADNANDR